MMRYPRDASEFDRSIGFIDATFALALTLLVTTLDVDHPQSAFASLSAFGDAEGAQLIAFAIAFAVIASYWQTSAERRDRVINGLVTPAIFVGSVPLAYLASPGLARLAWLSLLAVNPSVGALTARTQRQRGEA
jgi:hypothetical protein